MSWQERVRGDIQLTSPGGNVFNAKWIGNDRSMEKKLGIFEYPGYDGTIIQDLGVNGIRYPLTIQFDGLDHDLNAERFFESCRDRGPWDIIHPVKGNLSLQLVSVSEQIQPVTSGNITVLETQWIEPADETVPTSTAQLGAEVNQQATQTNATSAGQYAENLNTDTAGATIANAQAVDNVITTQNKGLLNDIAQLNSEIANAVAASQRGIQDTLQQTVLEPLTLAGQIQQSLLLPLLAVNDINGRVEGYKQQIETTFEFLPDGNNDEANNQALAYELSLSACIVGTCQSIVSGELTTQSEATEYADTIADLFSQVVDALDAIQENFVDNPIDAQYFSNTSAYSDLANIVGRTIAYLLRSTLDLRTEKRIILTRTRCPIEIVVTEYGSLGEDDSNLDFFISTNQLIGNDVRILNAGREVVVYV